MKKLVLAAIGLCFSVGVNAACTKNDLTGSWVSYITGNSNVSRCSFGIDKSLNVTAGSACSWADNSTAVLTGSASIDKTCHVTAVLYVGLNPINIDSYISKGKDSMAGMEFIPGANIVFNGVFVASKL